ncbi:MAG: hypothetical protein WB761_03010 [Solirubrobacteraceae bacterium]
MPLSRGSGEHRGVGPTALLLGLPGPRPVVEPGTSAQYLLAGGSVAVAIAAAGLRTQLDGAIRSIAVPLAGPTNDVARETASALAANLRATVRESRAEPVDLIVVGSQPDAPAATS